MNAPSYLRVGGPSSGRYAANVCSMTKIRVLELVRKLAPTTVRDIAEEADLSSTTVYQHLQSLKAESKVTWEAGKARTIRPST